MLRKILAVLTAAVVVGVLAVPALAQTEEPSEPPADTGDGVEWSVGDPCVDSRSAQRIRPNGIAAEGFVTPSAAIGRYIEWVTPVGEDGRTGGCVFYAKPVSSVEPSSATNRYGDFDCSFGSGIFAMRYNGVCQ